MNHAVTPFTGTPPRAPKSPSRPFQTPSTPLPKTPAQPEPRRESPVRKLAAQPARDLVPPSYAKAARAQAPHLAFCVLSDADRDQCLLLVAERSAAEALHILTEHRPQPEIVPELMGQLRTTLATSDTGPEVDLVSTSFGWQPDADRWPEIVLLAAIERLALSGVLEEVPFADALAATTGIALDEAHAISENIMPSDDFGSTLKDLTYLALRSKSARNGDAWAKEPQVLSLLMHCPNGLVRRHMLNRFAEQPVLFQAVRSLAPTDWPEILEALNNAEPLPDGFVSGAYRCYHGTSNRFTLPLDAADESAFLIGSNCALRQTTEVNHHYQLGAGFYVVTPDSESPEACASGYAYKRAEKDNAVAGERNVVYNGVVLEVHIDAFASRSGYIVDDWHSWWNNGGTWNEAPGKQALQQAYEFLASPIDTETTRSFQIKFDTLGNVKHRPLGCRIVVTDPKSLMPRSKAVVEAERERLQKLNEQSGWSNAYEGWD